MRTTTQAAKVAEADALADYETWLRSWASATTTKARVDLARRLLAEWGIDGFTADNIVEFLGRPRSDGKPKARWSKATYHANLTDFCQFLVASGRIEDSPMDGVKSVK